MRRMLFAAMLSSLSIACTTQGSETVRPRSEPFAQQGGLVGPVAEGSDRCYFSDRYGGRYVDACPASVMAQE